MPNASMLPAFPDPKSELAKDDLVSQIATNANRTAAVSRFAVGRGVTMQGARHVPLSKIRPLDNRENQVATANKLRGPCQAKRKHPWHPCHVSHKECMYVCMYVCPYVCVCMCVCMYVCMYVCLYVCMCVCDTCVSGRMYGAPHTMLLDLNRTRPQQLPSAQASSPEWFFVRIWSHNNGDHESNDNVGLAMAPGVKPVTNAIRAPAH